MKKLKLSSLELEGVEVLNRDQLIRIVGGDDEEDSPCYNNCTRFCCDKGNGHYEMGICGLGAGRSYCCEEGSPTYWC